MSKFGSLPETYVPVTAKGPKTAKMRERQRARQAENKRKEQIEREEAAKYQAIKVRQEAVMVPVYSCTDSLVEALRAAAKTMIDIGCDQAAQELLRRACHVVELVRGDVDYLPCS